MKPPKTIDHLFIVGAGFSHYAGLPLTSDFTEELLNVDDFPTSGPSAQIVNFLREFVFDTFDHKRSADAKFWPHLEDMFTCLDLSANTGHHLGPKYSPADLRTVRRALIVRIIRMLRHRYLIAKKTPNDEWKTLDRFFSMVSTKRCAFLSMNWDTVIEEGIIRTQSLNSFDYGCAALPAEFHKSKIRLSPLAMADPIQVLKPHGSVNWMYCDSCRQLFWFPANQITKIAKQLFRKRDWDVVEKYLHVNTSGKDLTYECPSPSCRASALGTRLATFSYRKAFNFPMYESSWISAERLLREAKTWIFIGYSLPAADFEFKHLLKHVQLSRVPPPQLVLISGGGNAGPTVRNYQKFFGPHLQHFNNGLSKDAIFHLRMLGALKK